MINFIFQERNDKEFMICLTPKPSQRFLVYCIQIKENIYTEKELLKENGGVKD